MALTAKDKKEFQQLRQQLQPVLSSTKNQLLQRIQGEIGADINTGSKPLQSLPERNLLSKHIANIYKPHKHDTKTLIDVVRKCIRIT